MTDGQWRMENGEDYASEFREVDQFLTRWWEDRNGQCRRTAVRQAAKILSLVERLRVPIRIEIDRRAKHRRIVRQPQLHPATAPRGDDIREPRADPRKIVRQMRDE